WCNYWVHVLHLNTDSGKMSKSSGEFLTVSLLESKGYDPLAYRFFCLQSHYRKSLVFSWENLDNAVVAYEKLIARVMQLSTEGEVDAEAFAQGKANFQKALDNDLNTSLAITAVYDVLKAKCNDATKRALLLDFDAVLSLELVQTADKRRAEKEAEEKAAREQAMQDPFVAEILTLIDQRAAAKKAKDFAEADRIRQYLLDKGVTLLDTREGTTYQINK
ncbi:MAG: cysteine--tRNA ligase, partial [Clostridia bacterium]|nr:cysteine--tRNA ligase [Clostridia bacterium]